MGTHHLAEPAGDEVVLEPFEGGRWYERATDGTETGWGSVLAAPVPAAADLAGEPALDL